MASADSVSDCISGWKTFATAGYSWLECGLNALLQARADSRKKAGNQVLSDDQVLMVQMAGPPFHKREVRIREIVVWARRTGLYSELSS